MPPKLLWTCGVVPFDLTHGTISGRCGLQHHGLKQKVVCVFHKCREVSEGEMHGMNLGCIVRPWQTLNHAQFYWTNSWWQPPPVGEVWHSNQVENVKAVLLSCHCWHWARLLHPSVVNIPLELIIRIILLETQNAQGKLSATLFHNFSKAYHAVFIHFFPLNAHHCWGFWPFPPRRSVGTRTPALEDSGERQRRSLENSATMETGGNHWDWLLASQMAVFLLVGCFSLFFHKEIWRWTRLLEYHHATEKDSSQKVFNIGEDPEFIMSAKKSSVMSHQLLMSWNQCDFWPERDHHVIGNQLLWLKCKKDCRPLIWLKLIDDISVYYRYVRYVYVYIYDNI